MVEPYISLLEKIEREWNISIRLDPLDYVDYQYAMQDFATNEVSDPYLTENLDGYQFDRAHIMQLKAWIEQSDYNIEWFRFKHNYLVDSLKRYLDFDPETTTPHEEINGIFNDDGTKVDIETIPVPGLCMLCRSYYTDNQMENLFCLMNRNDQKDQDGFVCGTFEKL